MLVGAGTEKNKGFVQKFNEDLFWYSYNSLYTESDLIHSIF